MTEVNLPRVYADFQNADAKGRLRLNAAGTLDDLARQKVQLRDGLVLDFYSDDTDDDGAADELRVAGRVEFSRDEQVWVAAIDWAAVRHASDEIPKSPARKAAS
jgi:hypothetical protein